MCADRHAVVRGSRSDDWDALLLDSSIVDESHAESRQEFQERRCLASIIHENDGFSSQLFWTQALWQAARQQSAFSQSDA